jgi:hypothetical protein
MGVTLIASDNIVTLNGLGQQLIGLTQDGLGHGKYTLDIIGKCPTCSGGKPGAYSGPFGLAPSTPISDTLPLFVSGLALVGFLMWRGRRQQEVTGFAA